MSFPSSDLEATQCLFCYADDTEPRFTKEDLSVVRCRRCHLSYVNPRLTPKALSRLYNADVISPHSYYKQTLRSDQKTFAKRLTVLHNLLGDRKKVRILDIGCNIGTLLFEAEKRGWECHGIDINAQVKSFFTNSKVELRIGDVVKTSYPTNYFDLIIMNDLIEHIPEPHKLLKKVHTLLKEDGLLFMVTPDGGSFMARVLGKHWFHLKPREHLYYFSKSHLRRLFRETGFMVLSFQHMGRYRSLDTLAEKSASLLGPLSRLAHKVFRFLRLDRLVVPFNLYDEYAVIARKS